MDSANTLHNLYEQTMAACLAPDRLSLSRINSEISLQQNSCEDGDQLLRYVLYKWCCLVMQSHMHSRQENFHLAMDIANRIIRERMELDWNSRLSPDQKKLLRFRADFHLLYITGLCKWVGPHTLRGANMGTRIMLLRWMRLQRELLEANQQIRESLRGIDKSTGQCVLQAGLRYAEPAIHEAFELFNRCFDEKLNFEIRHYTTNHSSASESHIYWSMELCKVMYSGQLYRDELAMLIARERKALLSSSEPGLDHSYAEVSYEDFSEIIARRFCRDGNSGSSLSICLLPLG